MAEDPTNLHRPVSLNVAETDQQFEPESETFARGVDQFDSTQMKTDFAAVSVGKRRSGKSHLARHILKEIHHKYHSIVVFTGTKFNGFWQAIMPTEYIHEGYDEQKLLDIVAAKEQEVLKCVMNSATGDEHSENCKCDILILFDDVVSEQHLRSDTGPLQQLYVKGRHLKIAPWLLSQYAYAVSPTIRNNCDYIFIHHQNQRRSKEALADEFLSQISRRDAAELMSRTTPGYQTLVVDNSGNSDDLRETLRTITAPEKVEDFAVGDDEYYQAVAKQPTQMGKPDELKAGLRNQVAAARGDGGGGYPRVLLNVHRDDRKKLLDLKYYQGDLI